MDYFLFFFALVAFLLSTLWTLRAIRTNRIFHNPLAFPLIFWIFSYPVRYALTLFKPDIFFQSKLSLPSVPTVWTLIIALFFASAFVAMLGFGLRIILPLRDRILVPINIESVRFNRRDQLIVHSIFILYAVAFVYLSFAYGVTGLYEDFAQIKKNLVEVLLGEIANLVWLILSLCLLAFFRSNKSIYLFEALFILLTLLYTAFSTTSKGVILSAGLFILLILGILGRRLSYSFSLLLLIMGIMFGVISYQMREIAFFEVRNADAPLVLLSLYGQLELSFDYIVPFFENNIIVLLDRFTYYGDALILMANGATLNRNDLYILGSLVEFGNFIPTIIWENRPHLSFNHYLTSAVWGLPDQLSETPIGRIGEAFYIGHWWGFIYAFMYSIIFSLFCLLWKKARTSIFGTATWIGLVMVWILPDAYILYGIKQVFFTCLIGMLLHFSSKRNY